MTDKVEVIGADRLQRTLHDLAADLGDMTPVNQQVANLNRSSSAARAPRRTGRLAASLQGKASADEANVESGLVYAPVIHNGWPGHNIRANPFARKAVEETTGQQVALYSTNLNRLVSQVKGA